MGSAERAERERARWYRVAETAAAAFFDAQRRRVRAAAGRARRVGDVLASVERVILEDERAWTETLWALFWTVGRVYAASTYRRLSRRKADGPDLGQVEPTWQRHVLAWLERAGAARVVAVSETTRAELRALIRAGIAENLSIPDLAKRIDRLYLQQIIPARSTVIARTEVVAASNLGSQAGAVSTGLPLMKVWLSTADRRSRPAHFAASGQARRLDEPYTVMGQALMFPGDTSLGATAKNVIMCRCTEVYESAVG